MLRGKSKRLEKIFRSLGQTPEADSCAGIEGLIKEKKLFMREKPTHELREFFNIGDYNCLRLTLRRAANAPAESKGGST